jgi:hypothetical protein
VSGFGEPIKTIKVMAISIKQNPTIFYENRVLIYNLFGGGKWI